jgi:signal peptidase I
MEPTILFYPDTERLYQDHVVIDKLTYKFRLPKRGEIIVFSSKNIKINRYKIKEEHYTKRIVGLPGETISIKPPYIYINGKRLEAPLVFKKISECKDGYKGYFLHPGKDAILRNENNEIKLADNEYFVLGDNSQISLDSRAFGPIKRKDIISRATKIIWPPSRIRNLE